MLNISFNLFSKSISNLIFGFTGNERKKKKRNRLTNIIKTNKCGKEFLKYLFILNIIISIIALTNKGRIIYSNSTTIEIKIKLTQITKTTIFRKDNSDDNTIVPPPDNLFINENEFHPISGNYLYDFVQIENNIKFIWNNDITSLKCMFNGCLHIAEIDFITFNAPKIEDMSRMFYFCSSLTSLNLSIFNTSKISNMDSMFQGCSKLEYIGIEHVKKAPLSNNIFEGTPEKLFVCSSNYDEWYCYDRVFLNCINAENQYDKQNCSIKDINLILENKNVCKNCGSGYYKIPNEFINGLNVFRCFKTPEGYYLNNDDLIYENCYSSCKTCEQRGNQTSHNCIKCKDNNKYKHKFNFSDYFNCYDFCSDYYYIDGITNETFCTKSCPENYSKLIINKTQCVNDCSEDPIFKYEYNNICYDYYFYTTEIINIYNYETDVDNNKTFNKSELVNNIIGNFLSNFNLINSGHYLEQKIDNILITLTTTKNEKLNYNKNKTTINLLDCEYILKNSCSISEESSLYILKIEVKEEGMKIPKIEYEVYYSNNNLKLIQLNLTKCKGKKIDISIPVSINDDIDIYNINSDYYNNICSKTLSKNNIDITLSDRKNIFIDNNMTLCEEDCSLIEYNKTTEKAKCSCLIKLNLPFINDIKFDKDKLYKSFTDINNIINIKIIKCYKNVFILKGLIKNYGFYIFLFTIIIFFICLSLFYCRYYSKLKKEIYLIIDAKKFFFNQEKEESNKIKRTNTNSRNKKKNINKKTNSHNIKGHNNKSYKNKTKEIQIKSKKNPPMKMKKQIKNKKKRKIKNLFLNNNNNIKNYLSYNFSKDKKKIRNNNYENINNNNLRTNLSVFHDDNKNKIYKEIISHNDEELNSLEYKKALIYDKRTCFQFYLSLLKSGHLLLFSFYCQNRDYNSQIIKIFLFVLFLDLHFTINALFFNDKTMHNTYLEEGNYNFIYQIPQIIYSSLISAIISLIIKFLALSDKSVLELKNENKNLDIKSKKLLAILKIKFILFFIFSFILLIIITYYICCFCGIYINT